MTQQTAEPGTSSTSPEPEPGTSTTTEPTGIGSQPQAQPMASQDTEQYAVYDEDLTQYVSGVSNKADAGKAKTELAKSGITKGHRLTVRKVSA